MSIRPPRVPTLAKGPHLSGYSKGEHLVLGKSIAHDMKSGAEGAHFFGALLLTFSFDKHILFLILVKFDKLVNHLRYGYLLHFHRISVIMVANIYKKGNNTRGLFLHL